MKKFLVLLIAIFCVFGLMACGGQEVDEIFEQGALELEYDKRKVFYNRYQQIIYDERPMIYLYTTLSFVAIRDKIKNLYPTSLSGSMHNIHELYIDNDD